MSRSGLSAASSAGFAPTAWAARLLGVLLLLHGGAVAWVTCCGQGDRWQALVPWSPWQIATLITFELVAGALLSMRRGVAGCSGLFVIEGLLIVHGGAAPAWWLLQLPHRWADPAMMLIVMVATGLALQPAHGFRDTLPLDPDLEP